VREFDLTLPQPGTGSATGRTLRIRTDEQLYIPKVLQREGLATYEPETLAVFLTLLERRGGPVFDVGANVGVFSLLGAALTDAEVIAFEPTPDLAAVARGLARDNGLRFEVEEIALGASTGTATFYLSSVTDSSNSLLEGFRPSDRAIDVATETLDDHVQRTGRAPAVLKIDTEATEPDVFRGGARTIAEHRPWIICEVLARRTEAELEELLSPFGYTWYQITAERKLVPRRELFGDRAYRFNNWLFAPEAAPDDFWAQVTGWRERLVTCVPPPPPPAPPVEGPSAPPPAAKPERRRGVYGRKKMVAGVLTGVAIGVAGATAPRRRAES
jgi:FkbM family methyltransferase